MPATRIGITSYGSGFSGFSGLSGYSGTSGFSGFSGYSGTSGFSGVSGYSGISGFSGYSGISGFSGYSGYSGISGFSGYSGISGFSGVSGYSGVNGVAGGVLYYLRNDNSDIGGFKQLNINPDSIDPESSFTAIVNSGSGEVLINKFLTVASNPDQLYVSGGSWIFDTYASVDDTGGTTTIAIRFYKRDTGGTETELFNTETAEINSVSILKYTKEILQGEFNIGLTDRLIVKYYAKTTSSTDVTVSLYVEGAINATHVHTPVSFVGASGFSGYSGTSGFSGVSGYSGTSGFSGVSGYSGTSGVSGFSGVAPSNPSGAIIIYGGSSAPTGYLMCDGTSYTTVGQAALFAIIGYAYGGSGANFNVPDLRQRFPLGKATAGTGSTLGGTGGSIDHTHSVTTGSKSVGAVGLQTTAAPASQVLASTTNNPPFQVVNYIIKT